MAVKFKSTDTTQYRINLLIDDNDVNISLTKDFGVWQFAIKGNKQLTVEELIEICNLIYSKKIIAEDDCIVITINSTEPTYIRGASHVTSEILKSIKVTFSEKNNR